MTDEERFRRLEAKQAETRRLVLSLSRDIGVLKEAVLGLRAAVDRRLEELTPVIRVVRPIEGLTDEQLASTLAASS